MGKPGGKAKTGKMESYRRTKKSLIVFALQLRQRYETRMDEQCISVDFYLPKMQGSSDWAHSMRSVDYGTALDSCDTAAAVVWAGPWHSSGFSSWYRPRMGSCPGLLVLQSP